MNTMSVWEGGIRIVPHEEHENQVQTNEGQIKFDTCKYRSDKEIERVTRTCCTSTKEIGWECTSRKIFKLNSQVCATCTIYENKWP